MKKQIIAFVLIAVIACCLQSCRLMPTQGQGAISLLADTTLTCNTSASTTTITFHDNGVQINTDGGNAVYPPEKVKFEWLQNGELQLVTPDATLVVTFDSYARATTATYKTTTGTVTNCTASR